MLPDAVTQGSDGSLVSAYLRAAGDGMHPGALAYYASLDTIAAASPRVAAAIIGEFRDQRSSLKLIASENYSSLATQLAQGNLFTDKYAEGYPGHRFYAGCDNVDDVESEAARLACELFGAQHAYVQPHSGADANLVAFLAILNQRIEIPELRALQATDPLTAPAAVWEKVRAALLGQRLMALDLYSGGHLTHGYRHNLSGRLFEVHPYATDPTTQLLDLDAVRAQAREVRPLILLAGYSGYPRKINFAKMREIAEEVGAVFMVDMAHFAGLVAGRVFTGDFDPVPHAQVVTSTTHKTLRGPRGGLVLCTEEFAETVDRGCPAVLGGPLPHAIAAKAVAFRQALDPGFRAYAQQIVDNAQALALEFIHRGTHLVTGGTDNHMVILDVNRTYGLTGRQAESALRASGITLNRNTVPADPLGPWYTSGLRIGTPAATTLGMGEAEMREIASIVHQVLIRTRPGTIESGPRQGERSRASYELDRSVIEQARGRVRDLLDQHRLYPEIDLELLLAAPYAPDERRGSPAG